MNLAGGMVFPAADILMTRGMPVLFAIGYGSAAALDGERQAKAVAVLRKPYPLIALANALSCALLTKAALSEERPPSAMQPP